MLVFFYQHKYTSFVGKCWVWTWHAQAVLHLFCILCWGEVCVGLGRLMNSNYKKGWEAYCDLYTKRISFNFSISQLYLVSLRSVYGQEETTSESLICTIFLFNTNSSMDHVLLNTILKIQVSLFYPVLTCGLV